MQRRHLLSAAIGLSLAGTGALAQATLPPLQVWKDPNCGCCNDWVALLRADGFQVQVHDSGNNAVRQRLGLPAAYGSCHTGLVSGYVIEGHVAPGEIRRLLMEKPDALGLAVPGMPVGSPGMDGPVYGGRRDAYDVLLVRRDGSARVFQRHAAGAFKPTAGDTVRFAPDRIKGAYTVTSVEPAR